MNLEFNVGEKTQTLGVQSNNNEIKSLKKSVPDDSRNRTRTRHRRTARQHTQKKSGDPEMQFRRKGKWDCRVM